MATYTELLEDWPLPIGLRRPMTYVPISEKPCTRNIVSRRTRPHDPKTAKQIACRTVWLFCHYQWPRMTEAQRLAWGDIAPNLFPAFSLTRWLALQSPSRSHYASDDPSSITITAASATPGRIAIALSFTPSSATLLWGIVILRSPTEIITPDPFTAILIYPTITTAPIHYLDSPLKPGAYHYRAAACELTGKLGPFSSDVFATIP